ncbi:Aste57867_5687 [Aphanomyces stellatus]|uniref:Aste57867_5687 protein n=1 Tax=Aphanomyces stellatus TaxID=120398 RepID=A0A485KHG6_9STRA|nr:hypothetical protein As57867_005674 [Aphanomyces stellatus]VFT82727.1 Aste57867_5687 [Aphanomyces stellatus]
MASVPLQVQIFESLVPQVANQATSLERVLRVLCQKIETLEACINSINVGVVEMDSRLKTIAHNIEGGNEAFNAKSTFIPTLPTEKLRSDDNSAVVSHVMNALIMGHFRPLEKLKKKKKKHHDHKNDDVDVASVPDQGPRSARFHRAESFLGLDTRDLPHSARPATPKPENPPLLDSSTSLNIQYEEMSPLATVVGSPVEVVQVPLPIVAEAWNQSVVAADSPRLLEANPDEEKDRGEAHVSARVQQPTSTTEATARGHIESRECPPSSGAMEPVRPTSDETRNTNDDEIPQADASQPPGSINEPSQTMAASTQTTPNSSARKGDSAVQTVDIICDPPLLTNEGTITSSTPQVASPVEAITAVVEPAQPPVSRKPSRQRNDASRSQARAPTRQALAKGMVSNPAQTASTKAIQAAAMPIRRPPLGTIHGSSSSSSESEEEYDDGDTANEPPPSIEVLHHVDSKQLQEAGQRGWQVLRDNLSKFKRPKNVLFTKKKQLFTIANRLELLETKSRELYQGEKQLALLLEKKEADSTAHVINGVQSYCSGPELLSSHSSNCINHTQI